MGKNGFEMFCILILGLGCVLLLRFVITKKHLGLSGSKLKKLLIVHFLLVSLLLLTWAMSFFNVYWRGYGSTTIILLLTTISGVLVYCLNFKNDISSNSRQLLTLLTVLGTIVTGLTYWSTFLQASSDIYYDDNDYRLEETFQGIIAPASLPDLFIKSGIIEIKFSLITPFYLRKDQIVAIEIVRDSSDSVTVKFLHTADTKESENPRGWTLILIE